MSAPVTQPTTPDHSNKRAPPSANDPPLKKMRVSELLGIAPESSHAVKPDENTTFLTVSGTWAAAQAITNSIPRDQGLPLTILTGFLGAGKSTVLNYILKADHGMKIAVLINEFGEVDIDNQLVDTMTTGEEGEPVILNNGCICCTVSNGFIDAVQKVLERADANDSIPDYFIVETTGLADPKPIVDSVSATELREELYVDQVLTVVDASAWSDQHYGSDTARRQIEVADTVLLSKTDLVPDEACIKKVVDSIFSIRPNARILKSQKGHVPIPALFDLGLSLLDKPKKKTEKKEITKDGDNHADHNHNGNEHDHMHHKHEHGEDCDCSHEADKSKQSHLEQEGFTSISFVSELPFSLRRFKDDFMDKLPQGVFRAKGLLLFTNYETRFVFHWSGSRYNVEEDEWPEGSERKNQLVLIGRDLDKAKITTMLEGCVVRPGEESEEEEEEDGLYDGLEGEYGGEDFKEYQDEEEDADNREPGNEREGTANVVPTNGTESVSKVVDDETIEPPSNAGEKQTE